MVNQTRSSNGFIRNTLQAQALVVLFSCYYVLAVAHFSTHLLYNQIPSKENIFHQISVDGQWSQGQILVVKHQTSMEIKPKQTLHNLSLSFFVDICWPYCTVEIGYDRSINYRLIGKSVNSSVLPIMDYCWSHSEDVIQISRKFPRPKAKEIFQEIFIMSKE